MKPLSQQAFESLFETKWAPGEIVQFLPLGRHIQDFNISLEVLTGTVEEIKIGRLQQFYTIFSNGFIFDGIPEDSISQDVGVLFARIKDIESGVQRVQEEGEEYDIVAEYKWKGRRKSKNVEDIRTKTKAKPASLKKMGIDKL